MNKIYRLKQKNKKKKNASRYTDKKESKVIYKYTWLSG